MEISPLLFRDPLFVGALFIFLVSLAVFMWFTLALLLAAPRPRPAAVAGAAPVRAPLPAKPAVAPAPLPVAAAPPAAEKPVQEESNAVLESRLLEVTKRLTALEISEHKAAAKNQQKPTYLDPLLQRLTQTESDINKLKVMLSQIASNNRPQELAAIVEKVNGLQKVIEHLSGGAKT